MECAVACWPCVECCEWWYVVCKQIRNRARQLRTDLETAAAKHVKEKLRYEQIVASVHKSTQKLFMAKDQSLTSPKEYLKVC